LRMAPRRGGGARPLRPGVGRGGRYGGHPEPHRYQGREPKVAWHRRSFVKPIKSEGGYCSEVTASRRTPGEEGLRLGPPAEAAIALAMDMITVWGDVVVNGWRRQGLEGPRPVPHAGLPAPHHTAPAPTAAAGA